MNHIEGIPVLMSAQIHERPVVQSRSLEIAVGKRIAERADQMQKRFGCGSKARDRSRILRNFRTDEHNVEVRLVKASGGSDGAQLGPRDGVGGAAGFVAATPTERMGKRCVPI